MKKSIFIITGPGNHANLLLDIFRNSEYEVYFSEYYPAVSIWKLGTSKQEDLLVSKSNVYRYTEKVIGGIKKRLRLKKTAGNDLLFDHYDRFVSSFIKSRSFAMLMAWPQVSLRSIKVAKEKGIPVLLEYPMIHIRSWQDIMWAEYKKLGIKSSYNLFTGWAQRKMLEEIKLSDHVNVLSDFARRSFLQHQVDPQLLSVIPPGWDLLLQPAKKRDKTPQLLFVGRLDCLKGVHRLLESFKKLKPGTAELVLAGYISKEIIPFLETAGNSVKTVGEKNHAELKELYAAADIFVLPSVQESFGMVLTEALASGLYIVASSNTGAPDVIGHDPSLGVLFDPQKEADLDEKLIFALDHIKTHPSNAQAIGVALKKFSRDNYQNAYLTLVKDLLDA